MLSFRHLEVQSGAPSARTEEKLVPQMATEIVLPLFLAHVSAQSGPSNKLYISPTGPLMERLGKIHENSICSWSPAVPNILR
jgi:hypothetical protein